MTQRTTLALVLALAAGALAARGQNRAEDRARVPGDQDELRARAFSPDRTHARRRALLEKLPDRALVVLSSGRSTESDAVQHRANRDFLYMTGIEDAGCWLVLDAKTEVILAPPRNKAAEIWTGEHVYPGEETARRFGVAKALPVSELKAVLADALARGPSKVFTDSLSEAEKKDLFPDGTKLETAASAIASLRVVKDRNELALMKRAAEISTVAHIYCTHAITPDRFEFEVQGVFEGACRYLGAERQGYPSIVGSGPNSCVLHYDKDRRRMKAGDLLLIDAAAECGGYSADVTRTFPVSGKFTAAQRRAYDAVLKAQDAGIAACRVGGTIGEVNQAARAVLAAEGYGKYLPHGVSHWLGLDVHDAGDYAQPFVPGVVLTVEPGCYIAEQELGIRIEDDILVTEDGPVNLSEHAPRSADAIEALLAARSGAGLELPPLPDTPLPSLFRHKGRLY